MNMLYSNIFFVGFIVSRYREYPYSVTFLYIKISLLFILIVKSKIKYFTASICVIKFYV